MSDSRSALTPAAAASEEERAVWSTAEQNDLPDSCFAYVAPGGHRDAEGKTTPRDLRHLVYKGADGKPDEAHVRNALARLDQTDIPAAAKQSAHRKLAAAAKELGIELSDESKPEARVAQPVAQPEAQPEAPTPAPDQPALPDLAQPALPPAVAQRMAQVAERQRAAAEVDAAITRVTLPATVRVVDAARREFEVCATSEAVDSFGTVFSYEASKDAFQRWMRVGNVREMHAPVAVGRGLDLRFDDDARQVYVRGRVSRGAEPTWLKLEDGVLQGASIGANNVKWEDRMVNGRRVPVATRYDLVELSLVDNPSNPDAFGVSLIRSAEPNTLLLEGAREGTSAAQPAAAPLTDAQRAALFPETAELPAAATLAGAVRSEQAVPSAMAAVAADSAASSTLSAPAGNDPAAATMAAAAQEHRRSAWRLQQDEINRRRELQDEITHAGDAAVAAMASLQRGEDVVTYAARVANIRGAAEARALIAQKTRLRAEATQAAQAEIQRAQTATMPQATPAVDAVPPAQPAPQPATETPATRAVDATAGERNGVVIGIVETAPLPGDATDAQPAAELGGPATGSQATTQDEEHEHEHEHATADGARMRHSHRHAHGAGGEHDHLHTFRNGQPTDSRIVASVNAAPTATRAPLAQNGRETDIPAQAIRRPVSGSAQRPRDAQSALMTVTPGKVGHMVLPNTQDVEAVEFGVPAQADGRAEGDDNLTLDPADFHEGGHSPVGALHGVASDHAGEGAPLASRPAAPTRPAEALRPTAGNPASGSQSAGMVRAAGHDDGRPETDNDPDDPNETDTESTSPVDDDSQPGYEEAAAAGEDSDADDARMPSRPPAPTAIARDAARPPQSAMHAPFDERSDTHGPMDLDSGEAHRHGRYDAHFHTGDADHDGAPRRGEGPQDYSAYQQARKARGARGQRTAEAQRVGARLSAESRQAVHDMRDGAMAQVRMAAQHCGCPACAGILAIVNGGMLDGWGEHPQAGDEAADTHDDTAMFGELRAVRADVARRFAALEARLAETLDQLAAEVRTQVGDAQLTLSDHQRAYAAQTQRAVTTQITDQVVGQMTRALTSSLVSLNQHMSDQLTRMPDELATRAVSQLSSSLGELTETVSAVREGVERIERQPVASLVAPVAGLADKRVALAPNAATDPRTGALSPEVEIAYLQQMAAGSPAENTALRTQIATRITQLANSGRR